MSEGSQRVKDFFGRTTRQRPFGSTIQPVKIRPIPRGMGLRKAHSHPSEISENWESAFGQAVENFALKLVERQEESRERLAALEQEVKALKQQLAEANKSILIPIESLKPEPYELMKKVTALVVSDDGSWIATLVDANINASGETVPDSIANLKDMMIELFELLGKEKRLGKQPAMQLAYLRSVMRKRVSHGTPR
jgi:hypothetical protein